MSADEQTESAEIQADITCKPIDTLEEVLGYMDHPPTWAARCLKYRQSDARLLRNCDLHQPVVSSEWPRFCCESKLEAELNRYEEGSLPKTLVCHDMANGYHDDSYIDGTTNSEAYHFYDWAAIDIFCYFSHHFITIPPLAWINAAHIHNVKVMGTIITEWKDGEGTWDTILSSPETYRKFADSVVAITKHLRFEGWLLNVENKISRPQLLLEFVRYLREQLHREVPAAVLLWYDSVTVKGDLAWQNGLNEHNIAFFRACDGIFTNYSWRARDVAESAALAAREGRPLDVFVGVDVWGRNFYGGGHFNTHQAVKVAFDHGCSLAIFAPAWTHEAVDECERYAAGPGGLLDKYGQFLLREKALWDTLWPCLNTRVPARLPFRTSFCRGRGTREMRNGEVENDAQWYNLRKIEYQPNSLHGPHGYKLVKIENTANVSENEPVIDKNTSPLPGNDKDVAENEKSEVVTVDTGTTSKVQEEPNVENLNKKTKNQKNTIKMVKQIIKDTFRKKRKHSEEKSERDDFIEEEDGEQSVEGELDTYERGNKTTERVPTVTPDSPVVNPQPNRKPDIIRYKLTLIPDETPCIDYYPRDAFNGGSCLVVQPSDGTSSDSESRTGRLFHCEFPCLNKLIVSVVTKTMEDYDDQSLDVVCTMSEDETKKEFNVVLVGQDEKSPDSSAPAPQSEYQEFAVKGSQLKSVRKYILIKRPGDYVPIENTNNWKVRYFVVNRPGTTMTAISCRAALPRGPILLGQIGLCPQ